jgi:hypothetical protein
LVFLLVFSWNQNNWFFWFISDFDVSIDANIDVDKELKFNQINVNWIHLMNGTCGLAIFSLETFSFMA